MNGVPFIGSIHITEFSHTSHYTLYNCIHIMHVLQHYSVAVVTACGSNLVSLREKRGKEAMAPTTGKAILYMQYMHCSMAFGHSMSTNLAAMKAGLYCWYSNFR